MAVFALDAKATVYSLAPTPGNLGDLDHNSFLAWGLNWALPQGETITAATLSFTKIWDWKVEPDALYIHLLDTAPLGVNSWTDNEGGGDFFASSLFNSLGIAHVKLAEWSDPFGGNPAKAHNLSFAFNAGQLTALQGYLNSAGANGWARFGFGFDPDCHYYNSGVGFNITTVRRSVPEGGSSALLLGMAVGSIAYLRRKQCV